MTTIKAERIYFSKSLPFQPDRRQVIYVEDTYKADINSFIQAHHEQICDAFRNVHYEFCYLPFVAEAIQEAGIVRYYTPYHQQRTRITLTNSCLNQYLETQIHGAYLIVFDECSSDNNDSYVFLAIRIDNLHNDYATLFDACARLFDKQRQNIDLGIRYCTTSTMESLYDRTDDYADESFPDYVDNLIGEVREKINQLRQYGVNEMVLQSLLNPQIKLSRLQITANARIFLPDYDLEIKMPPLVKAVFFLFLRHPEGIVFKTLPDYRKELHNIYTHLTGRISTEAVMQSIMDVTNPCSNSINEKCARIREAFIREFDERLAEFYYITGSSGSPKRIKLSRDMVDFDWVYNSCKKVE